VGNSTVLSHAGEVGGGDKWIYVYIFLSRAGGGGVTSGYMFIFYIHSSHYEGDKCIYVYILLSRGGGGGKVTSGYMFIFYIHSSHYEMQKMLQVATFTNKLNFI